MSRKHFRNLKKVYTEEGFGQAIKYDFDKSIFRLLFPYVSEIVPGVFGVKNYQTLIDKAITNEDDKFMRIVKKSISGMLSLGSEAARYLITIVTYNETKSPEAALLAYSLSTSYFSMRNQFRVDRFYKPSKEDLVDKLEPAQSK